MKRSSITQITGDELRLSRLRAKLTQEKLAEKAGVERSLISDLERGVSNPSLYFFIRLARAIGEVPDHLLARIWAEYQARGGRFDDLPAGVKPRGLQASKPAGKTRRTQTKSKSKAKSASNPSRRVG